MSTECVMNCTIFRGKEKVVHENVAGKKFSDFIEAFAWLENVLEERHDEFEIVEFHRVGFRDEWVDLSKWDEKNNYWYSEIYSVELV